MLTFVASLSYLLNFYNMKVDLHTYPAFAVVNTSSPNNNQDAYSLHISHIFVMAPVGRMCLNIKKIYL